MTVAAAGRLVVAVYGTLRRGGHNHAVLGGARFLGPARTAARYTLLDLGVGFPGLVEGGQTAVAVELYAVSAATLARLDLLEGVAHGLYARAAVELHDRTEVLGYFLGDGWRGERRVIATGDWMEGR